MKHFLYGWDWNIPCARACELPTCKIKMCALCIQLHNSVLLYEFYKTLDCDTSVTKTSVIYCFFLLWSYYCYYSNTNAIGIKKTSPKTVSQKIPL
jgi:hypothetical protein